ncbi:MAG: hypothetical protein R3Y13_05520 [bacterium]
MNISYNELTKKDCCFTCAHYNSSRVNIIGFVCENGIQSYQRPDNVCGKHRDTQKSNKQLEADYEVLQKRCR